MPSYIQDEKLLSELNAPEQPKQRQYVNDPSLLSALGEKPKAPTVSAADRFAKGLRDPVDAGAQFLTNMLPKPVVEAGNRANNWLADATGLVGRLPEGGVDQQVRDSEKAYQASRGPDAGFDGARLLGNVANPANVAAIARLPQAATAGARMAASAGSGALSGALTPVTDGDDFWKDKAVQTSLSAVAGGALSGLAGAAKRVISPNASTDAQLQMLKREGVNPTLGQSLGGRWNEFEEKLQAAPLLGDMIRNARMSARDDFNNVAINRATAPIGVKVQGSGQDAVREAGDAVSAAYDRAASQVQAVPLDATFQQQMSQLNSMTRNMVPGMRDKFDSTVNDLVTGRTGPQGSILGSVYKDVDSELGQIASRYGKSQMASEGELGDAVGQLQNLLRQQMARSNPQVAPQIRAADEGWANLVRVENAAARAKNKGGVFTPGQLNMAISATDDSVRKRGVARGTSLMNDLGQAAQNKLGDQVPDSGTATRIAANALVGGGVGAGGMTGFLSPEVLLALGVGVGAYTKPMQKVLSAAVSSRPAGAQAAGNAVANFAPPAAPMAGALAIDGLRPEEQDRFADGGMIGDDDYEPESFAPAIAQDRRQTFTADREAQQAGAEAQATGAEAAAEGVSAARQEQKLAEEVGLSESGEDVDELGYADGGMIGEEEEEPSLLSTPSIVSSPAAPAEETEELDQTPSIAAVSVRPTDDEEDVERFADGGMIDDEPSLLDAPAIARPLTEKPEAVEEEAVDQRLTGFKNGGLIGAPAMQAAARALAFGRKGRY